jgi:triphosphoribosyl-dephospho-CoA synthase
MTSGFSPGTLAQVACLLEVTARKPGNVHRLKDFSDTSYLDFLLSALAIGPALDRAASGVGAAVLDAVAATLALVGTNTNLGMVLLLAPLAAVAWPNPLRLGVADVLNATTVEDARLVYRAIRLARPGGLGSAPEQDVEGEPSVSLLEAMRLASGRDGVARQYANGFEDVFTVALPALARALEQGHPLETAIVSAHLRLLAEVPDTLIARKRGPGEALEASRRSAEVLQAGWPEGEAGPRLLDDLDRWLREVGHARNPGTTADLVAAALFAALRDGTIELPLSPERTPWSPPLV